MPINKALSVPIELERKHKSYKACLTISTEYPQLSDKDLLLHPNEEAYFNKVKSEKRKKAILLGKLVSKTALTEQVKDLSFHDINIQKGVFEHPVIYTPSVHNTQVTISHSANYGAAIAFPEEHPMGIDIEAMSKIKPRAIASQCTKNEMKRLQKIVQNDRLTYALLWTTKESISKCIRTGLMVDFKQLEISTIDKFTEGYYIFHFRKFLQYKTYIIPKKDYCLAISLPKKSQLNIQYLISQLDEIAI